MVEICLAAVARTQSLTDNRYNSAVISTEPENEFIWAVVSPNYLKGQPFDIFATASTLATRSSATVTGLDLRVPQRMKTGAMGAPNGDILADTGPRINRTAYVNHLSRWQESIVHGSSLFENISTLECLTRYVTFERDASSLLLVSSEDILSAPGEVLRSNNSLLIVNYFGSSWDSLTVGFQLWECGWSNNFSCSRPETWRGDAAAVSAWNVYGYKIDYCLSQTSNLDEKCSIKFDTTIMIGMRDVSIPARSFYRG